MPAKSLPFSDRRTWLFSVSVWLLLAALAALTGCGSGVPLGITSQPANAIVQAGQSASFSVTAMGGSALRYQWLKNGTAIPDANSSTLTLSLLNLGDSGSMVYVQVGSGSEMLTSASATLTVTALSPLLSFGPMPARTFGDAPFVVAATSASSGAVTYAVVSGPATVSGATVSLTGTGTVTLQATQAASGNFAAATATASFNVGAETPALRFHPVAAQTFGGPALAVNATSPSEGAITYSVASGPATISDTQLTLTGAGRVVLTASQAANGNYAAASTSTSFAVAPAAPALAFAAVGARVFGQPSFPVSASSASGGAVTYAVVSGPATVQGSMVTLTGGGTVVLSASQAATTNYTAATAQTSFPVILNVALSAIAPGNQTAGPGTQAFSATSTGGPTNGIVWSASGGSFQGNVWTSPSTPGTYTITATSSDDPSRTVSTTATISMPVITTQPLGGSLCSNTAGALSVTAQYATGYQWYLGANAIAGATGTTYAVANATQAQNAGTYTVQVRNAAGVVTSAPATVIVGSSVTAQPANQTVTGSQMAVFSVGVSGLGPFFYQWFTTQPGSTAGSMAGTPIAGATAASYTTPAESFAANGTGYYAAITDSCGAALTSNVATLTVDVGPAITTQPVAQTIAVGGTPTFSVVALGTPSLAYQWFWVPAGLRSGTPIAGATAASYTVPGTAATAGNNGDAYFVAVTNPYGNVTSQRAAITVSTASAALSWVVGWGASPENGQQGSENPGGSEQSFRNFFYPTVPGTTERVHLSNLFGQLPLTIGAARLALAAASNGVTGNAIDPANDVPLTFQGSSSITLAPGQEIVSDPVQITYSMGQKLAVRLYVPGSYPALTQHESQVTTNYATPSGAGNKTADASGVSFTQTNTEWFVLTGVDVYGGYQGTVALFGSSSIDGHNSNFGDSNSYPVANVPVPGQDNDRPSDWLGRQLVSAGYNVGVLNAGTIGDSAGEDARTATGAAIAGVDRMAHDVLQQPGIKTVIIYLGGVDLLSDCVPATNVEASLTNMVNQAYIANVRVVLATVPPAEYCLSAQPLPSASDPFAGDVNSGTENPGSLQRRTLNDWIRTTGAALPGVVGVADFDAALLDPAHPDFMLPNLNSGDNFHPNGTGYGVQSNAIPLGILLEP